MADFDAPPPTYDDVITDPQPSAPQPDEIGPPEPYNPAFNRTVQDHGVPQDTTDGNDYGQENQSSSKLFLCVQWYTNYSMAHHLRKYIVPRANRLDPELDVEAKFSRQTVREAQSRINKGMRKQCITGWLWCFGFLQVILYFLLPIGMLATGIVGFDQCPHNSNAIVAYLLLDGSLVVALIITRTLPSIMTCCRNRNYFQTGRSKKFTGCICAFEFVFYLIVLANLAVLILGSAWIFRDIPSCSSSEDGDSPTCSSSENYCARFVVSLAGFFNIFQYIMYTITLSYIGLVVCCVRNMDQVYGSRE